MARSRPLNRIRHGVYLIATDDGATVYSDEVEFGKYQGQKGLIYHRKDLDEPSREDLRRMGGRRRRSESLIPGPRRNQRQTFRFRDIDGNLI